MTASNHLVTGALIAAVAPSAIIAVPLAFLSHFVLDALPHYGHETDERYWLTKAFTRVLVADGIIALSLMLALFAIRPEHWILILICGTVALLPDALWLPYYFHDRKFAQSKARNAFAEVLKKIQWGERPWGIYVELVWFATTLSLLIAILR